MIAAATGAQELFSQKASLKFKVKQGDFDLR
jgi:hypothetical protein